MTSPRTMAVVVVTVASLAVVGLVVGTRGGDPDASEPVRSLGDIEGRWTPVDDSAAPAPVVGALSLTFGDGVVLVETGCNTGRAEATVARSRLVVEQLRTTRKACVPPLSQQETWVIDMLTNNPRLELRGPTVSLLWGVAEEYRLSLREAGGAAAS